MVGKPYKFLDYYRPGDKEIFFGRERETRILFSDVVVNRLVVLFAPTGTGKTSLINAGVRPQLEDQGYATFFVRVSEDPSESAREELLKHDKINSLQGDNLADQLEGVVALLGCPIVIFFDQFEEFFLYVYYKNRAKGNEFIADIARLYHNRDSGVRVVFSMREEFFADMDAFRDEIPTIFHNDSNLRLRRFDKNQARDAIVYPARTFKTRLDSDLVDRVLGDLAVCSAEEGFRAAEEGLIEPAQLQIVCDTLWLESAASREKEGRITLNSYLKLGGDEQDGNIAKQILHRRLEEGFSKIESRAELNLLARLLPLLRTKEHTKYVRDLEGLVKELGTDEASLSELLLTLENIGFIRRSKRDRVEVIELLHDYLVNRLDDLANRVLTIWPQRRLKEAFAIHLAEKKLASPEDLETIAEQLGNLSISLQQGKFLLRSAIAQGSTHMLAIFNLTARYTVDVWKILHATISDGHTTEAINAINLSRGIASQIKGEDKLSLDVAAKVFRVLAKALAQSNLTAKTQETLADLIMLQNSGVSAEASRMLLKYLHKSVTGGRVAVAAIEVLGRIETPESIALLKKAIGRGDLTLVAQDALARLMFLPKPPVASAAKKELLAFYDESLEKGRISGAALIKLSEAGSKQSVAIFSRALALTEISDEAKFALESLSRSANARISEAARNALSDFHSGKPALSVAKGPSSGGPPQLVVHDRPTPSLGPGEGKPNPVLGSRSAGEILSGFEWDSINPERCVLILGGSIHAPAPNGSKYHYPSTESVPLPSEMAAYLGERSRFSEPESNLQRVAQYFEIKFSRSSLMEHLRSMLSTKKPSPLLHALARLPFSNIISTNYDQLFEQALIAEDKKPFVSIHSRQRSDATRDFQEAAPNRPFLFKIFGDIEDPESVVVTEDDFIELILRMGDQGYNSPIPRGILYALSRNPCLVVGFSLRDFTDRVIWKSLRRNIDEATMATTYVLDPHPDSLFVDLWERHQRLIKFIPADPWIFVPELYRRIMGTEMPG